MKRELGLACVMVFAIYGAGGLVYGAAAATGDSQATFSPQTEQPSTGTVPKSAYPLPPAGPAERRKAGFPIAGFLLLPEFGASVGYDDNVFATPDSEKEDELAIFSPSLVMKSDWRRNRLKLSAGGDLGRYRRYKSENYNDYYADSSGALDLPHGVNLFGGAGYDHNHEARTSPDAVNGLKPTTYGNTHVFAGLAFGVDKVHVRIGTNMNRLNFSNVPSSSGEIINDDRDRSSLQAGARVSYIFNQQLHPFLQGNYDRRLYDTRVDQYGFMRSSNGYRLVGGLAFNFRPNLEGEVMGGYMRQKYADPRFSAVSRPDFGIRVGWRRSAGATLSAFVDRRIEESTVPGSSGYVSTRAGLNLERALTSKWSVNAHTAVMDNDYTNSGRIDRVIDAGAGLSYQLGRHLSVALDYRLLNRDSTDPAADFFSNQVFLSFRSLLYPLPTPPYTPVLGAGKAPAEDLIMSGLYLGVQTGYGSLDTQLSGARGEGTETAQYGSTGASSALFAGYGGMWGRWYLGLEGRGETSDADWTHTKPGGRVFSVDKDPGFGASLRGGYLLDTGALLFTSAGSEWTRFETHYQLDSTSPNVTAKDTVLGWRYGFGLDMPIASHAFVRMAYTYTTYNKYYVNYGDGIETFDNNEGVFHVGLGWLLEGYDMAAPAHRRVRVADASGFYAGGAVGYGAVNTPIHADQTQSSGPPTTLDADFSSQGMVTNVFAGYGLTLGHLYLGVEADTNLGKEDWSHARQQGGRSFSVDKKGGLSGSLRVGWELDSGTLLYVHYGWVRSKFHTTYIKGSNPDYWISRDEKSIGARYGLGVDVPLSRALFMRLDYSYTNYDPYQFTTAQSYPDTVRFDNNEALVKLGLGFRL